MALVAASVALVLFGIPLAIGLAQFATAEERASLQRVADLTARAVYDDLDDDHVPDRLPRGDGTATVALYDDDALRLVGNGPPVGDDQVDRVLHRGIVSAPPDELVVVAPVRDGEDVIGVVRVSGSLGAVLAGLVPLWLGMLALAVLVLGAVWLLARRLAGRLSRPLEDLAHDAGRLGDGDFGVRPAPTGMHEVDQVGTALGHTAERLDDLLARERAFSAEASHQLRTPLAGLRLRLESALDGPEQLDRSAVTDGLASVDRLERTIDELLLLARERRSGASPVDVARLLIEAESEWTGRLARDGREFRTARQRDLPDPPASAAAVRQIVGVLLDNALQHGAGTVTVTAREAGPDAVALDVADEGPGVAPENLTGTRDGLGVAMARRLAESEGGRLTARRSPSVVTLLLPLAPLP